MRGAGRQQGRILCLPEPSQTIETDSPRGAGAVRRGHPLRQQPQYGSRRIVVELRKIGIVANGKTARRMMTRKGLASCRGLRKHVRDGKASDKGGNVLNGEFSVRKRNGARCGDIARMPTGKDGPAWPPASTCSLARWSDGKRPPHQRESGDRRP